MAQTNQVAEAIRRVHPGLEIRLEPIVTQGDIQTDKPLPQIGGKGLFTLELERALLDGRVDLAVHSAKDLPAENPQGLGILCVPSRAPVADVLVTPQGIGLYDLPLGARIGTSSLRRQLQLAALRPGLRFADIRGNIDTRIRKMLAGQYDAIVLARAGLLRAGMTDVKLSVLAVEGVLPAPGQAALALQGRTDDEWLGEVLQPVNDPVAAACLSVERSLLTRLGMNCHMPFAALCERQDQGWRLRVWLADPGTGRALRFETAGSTAEAVVEAAVRHIEDGPGRDLLAACGRAG